MNLRRLFPRMSRLVVLVTAVSIAAVPFQAQALSDGTPSTTANAKFGTGFNFPATDAVLQPDGKIVVIGGFTSYNGIAVPGIVRINTDGTIDTAFNTRVGTGSGGNGISAMALQPDGKIVLGGTFTSWNGTPAGRIARIQADGSTDQSFTINVGAGITGGVGSSAGAFASDIEIQSDGKIVIVGDFTQYQGATQEHVLRLNTDGTPDTAFNTNAATVLDIYVFQVRAQSTGHLVIIGGNIGAGGSTNAGIVRLNSTGTLDSAFSTAIGTGAAAVAGGATGTLEILSDNSVVIGGTFTQFGTSATDSLAKVSSTGAIDNSFASTITTGIAGPLALTPFVWIHTLLLQSDNSLLVSGSFTTLNGVSSPGIARLTPTGTVDSSFGTKLGTGFNGRVRRMLNMPDGSLLVVGEFTSLNGNSANGIALLGTTPAATTTSTTTSTTTTIASATQRNLPATGSRPTSLVWLSLIVVATGALLLRRRELKNN